MNHRSHVLTRGGLGGPKSNSQYAEELNKKTEGAQNFIRQALADTAITLLLSPTNTPWGILSPAIRRAIEASHGTFGKEPTSAALKLMGLDRFDP